MSTSVMYGGWVVEPTVATGGSFNLINLVGWVAAAGVALTSIGTGGEMSLEYLQRNMSKIQHWTQEPEVFEVKASRVPSEDLARIREILAPSISDLATTFGVTRQSIYNWINGEPVAEENAAKLRDLARAADTLAFEGIKVTAVLLKRKLINGMSLMEATQIGASASDTVSILVDICKRETAQRERMNARFASRVKGPASADFDLPDYRDSI